jgi:hypothetical protein
VSEFNITTKARHEKEKMSSCVVALIYVNNCFLLFSCRLMLADTRKQCSILTVNRGSKLKVYKT